MRRPRACLSQNLKALRKKEGLSQVDLAKLVNVNKSYICNLESQKGNPTLGSLEKIADCFGVSVDKLFT